MAQTIPATTPNLKLPVIEVGSTGQAPLVNAANNIIDMVGGQRVLDKDLNAPPGSPSSGDVYIVGGSPTGAWSGKAKQLAGWYNSAWVFVAPKSGWEFYVVDEDLRYKYDGTNWTSVTAQTTTALTLTWITKTASFSPSGSEAACYWVDATSGAVNITFPAPASNAGKTWTFKRKDAVVANAVTFLPNASETIERGATLVGLTMQDDTITISCDGTNWVII